MSEMLDKILPYEARAEFYQIPMYLANGVSRKNAFEIYWHLDCDFLAKMGFKIEVVKKFQ